MLSLSALADLADAHREALAMPVGPLHIGDRVFDVDSEPIIMGAVNLSRDSTYRESIATTTDSAVRKVRVMAAQGADVVDIGAESSTARAERVAVGSQIDALVPVIESVVPDGITVSVETYEPEVVEACLRAGATVLNMTGIEHEDRMLDLAAQHAATVIMCFTAGANVRAVANIVIDDDPIPGLLDHFTARVARARARGVERLVIDPGMGFYYGNLTDPGTRARHQAHVLLNGFRMRTLGVPICNALPHAFDLFGDQFRTAEGFYAVLAMLGGTSVFRTHEVAHVRAVLQTMCELST
jgi:dihydropteroate synthase